MLTLNVSTLAGGPRVPFHEAALPSPLRSLLDDLSFGFLHELWRVLKRDEPLTAL